MLLAGMLLVASAVGTADETEAVEIQLPDRQIRAGDIAVIPGSEHVVVAVLPAGSDDVEFTPAKVRSLVSARLPGAAFSLRYSKPVNLAGPPEQPVRGICWRTQQVIAAGDAVLLEAVEETACSDEERSTGLGFDRQRKMPVALQTIKAGTYLGSFRPSSAESIEAGTDLTFRSMQGSVIVERKVTALQNGKPGGRIFARTAEGEVISAPILASKKESDQ